MERNERNSRNTRTERGAREEGGDRANSRDTGRNERPDRNRSEGEGGGRDTSRGSSRGSKFEYRKPTAEDVKKRAEQRGGNEFDSIFKPSAKIFKVNDGNNLIRIVPPTWPEPKHFGYDIFVHYGVGPDGQTYLCPKEMLGEPCPVCEERAHAVKDGDDDYAKELKVSKRVVYYIIDRDVEKEGVQIWAAPWTVDRDLNTLIVDKRSGEVLAIDDPENGYDIEFTKTGAKLTTKYIGLQIARRESDLGKDSWLQFAIDNPIPDQLAYFSYDHIAKVFGGKTSKKDEDVDDKQDRELREGAERSTRGSSKADNTLTFEGIHEMTYDELCAIVDEEKLDIDPKDSTTDAELADWVCEDLKIEKSTRRPARDAEAENPRDKLRKMREGRE
jgi:hypothetical protein